MVMVNEKRADRAVRFFEHLKHTKGRFFGQPFTLLDWQSSIIRDVYGRVNRLGLRTIKYVYIEVPKKNGKSELAAGAGLYHTFADGERNGEVYGCAADRGQASIVFDVAVDMIDQLPALKKRTKLTLSQHKLTDRVSDTTYKVISAEAYCLHPETFLDLLDGQRKLARNINSGDKIIGWDGQSLAVGIVVRTVMQPQAPIYRIQTHRGRELRITGEHLFWTMTPGRRPQDQTHEYEWVKAQDLKPGNRVRIGLGWLNTTEDNNFTEEAWALGAWAGDGECGRFRFTSIDPEIVSRLRRFIESIGSTLISVHSTRQVEGGKLGQYPIEHKIMGIGKRTKSAGREWIRDRFGQEARSHTKTVPEIIWRGGSHVWAAFLAGYLDTDGCIPTLTPCVKWASASRELLKSCQALLARLGINASLTNGLLTVSGRAQLTQLYALLSPYMALARKRQQLKEWIERPFEFKFNAYTTDRVVSVDIEDAVETISIEVDEIDTHVTNGIITHNTKHGLNISACIFDELHAQPSRELWDVMTFGAGDARTQPIWWIITTAGDDPDRVSIGWEQHEYARRLLAGEILDPTWYPVIYNYLGEDIYNPANWYQSNPSLEHTITLDAVQEAAEKARIKPADERLFRWLRLNQWTTTKLTTWLPLNLFDSTIGQWNRMDLLGRDCYLGLDLASTTDLAALCLLFPPQGSQLDWRAIWEGWIPLENMQERIREDHVPYDQWAAGGWITPTEGNVIDYTLIEEKILELRKLYNVIELDSDRAMATMLLQRLEKAGLVCVDIPQTFLGLTDALNQIEILLKGKPAPDELIEPNESPESQSKAVKLLTGKPLTGRMTHENNPVARWCFGNTSVAKNGQGYIKFVKEHKGASVSRTKRIDLTAAWVDAMVRARFYTGSVDLSAAILDDDWGM